MDGMHVAIPAPEYDRLCGYEMLVEAVVDWLGRPENAALRTELLERLGAEDGR